MPDRTHVQRALRAIKRVADLELFFEKLTSPDWLTPLAEEGLFNEPWPAQSDGKYVSFSFWPQSKYLVRVAAQAPDLVERVIEGVPATDNVRIHEDFADAALAMPAAVAAKLVPRAKEWLRSPYQLLLPDKLGRLIRHLVSGGELAAASDIAGELLRVEPGQPGGRPHGRFEDYYYREILKRDIPSLIEADPPSALNVLAGVLEQAVIADRLPSEVGPREDFSSVWQPAVEEHGQNNDYDVRPALVSAVRDAAKAVVASGRDSLDVVFRALDERPHKIFTRIGLYLLRELADRDLELAKVVVFDSARAEDSTLHHEYWGLAQTLFPRLSEAEQERFLDRLEAERESEEREADAADTPELFARHKRIARYGLFRQLTLLREYLPQRGKTRFEELAQEFTEVEHPEFLSYSTGVWVGPTSPKSSDDLRAMAIDELVGFLRQWKPATGFMEDSAEGLGRSISPAVAAEPEKYATRAMAFVGLDPTYVRSLIDGLRQAKKARRPFPWEPVLELCEWVVAQPRVIAGRVITGDEDDADPDWGWARKEIAGLVEDGLVGDVGLLPQHLRDRVWGLLAGLSDDPDPTPDHERRYGGENMDAMTLSINSVRGVAMQAVVKYALWIRRHLEQQEDKTPLSRGFDEMPGVRQVFEDHLDPDRDPSVAVRAVYGQWVPWLFLLDPNWTRMHLGDIFPRSAEHRDLRLAAWGTYLLYSRAFNDTLALLRDEYAFAIDRLGQDHFPGSRSDKPDLRLVDHVMIYYMRGLISLDDPGDLLQRFYRVASPDHRERAVSFLGHSLQDEQNSVPPPDVQERHTALLDFRLESSTPWTEKAEELAPFGWWFASGKLDQAWALSRLVTILRHGKKIEAEHLVVKQLASIAASDPVGAVEALLLIVEADTKGWDFSLWADDGRVILRRALEHREQQARDNASRTINLLAARGNRTYADLLSASPRGAA